MNETLTTAFRAKSLKSDLFYNLTDTPDGTYYIRKRPAWIQAQVDAEVSVRSSKAFGGSVKVVYTKGPYGFPTSDLFDDETAIRKVTDDTLTEEILAYATDMGFAENQVNITIEQNEHLACQECYGTSVYRTGYHTINHIGECVTGLKETDIYTKLVELGFTEHADDDRLLVQKIGDNEVTVKVTSTYESFVWVNQDGSTFNTKFKFAPAKAIIAFIAASLK